MDFIRTLFEGSHAYWGGGVSHSIFILALVITLGLLLGRIKVKNISLGLTWVLIVGIIFGYFNLNLNVELLHFLLSVLRYVPSSKLHTNTHPKSFSFDYNIFFRISQCFISQILAAKGADF